MSVYRLYAFQQSGALPAAVVLGAAQVPHEIVWIDAAAGEQHRPAYLAINPTGQIPALVLPDGTVMTESAALAWYLAERFPAADLLPPADRPERATLLRWLLFGATQLYEDDLRFYYAERYTTDPAGAPGVKAAGKRAFQRHVAMVADALRPGPFLLGERLTVVDVYLAMLATWDPDRDPADRPVECQRLIAAVGADPRVAPVWQRFGFPRPA